MGVEIKTDRSKWAALVAKAADAAVDALADQMMNDSLEKIPDDGEHTLKDGGRIEKSAPGERELVWGAKDKKSGQIYAGYQWYGMRIDGTHVVEHYTTPGTGKAWVDTARAENQVTWDKVAQNGFTKGMKE